MPDDTQAHHLKLLQEARECLHSDPDRAHAICVDILREDPQNPQALFVAAVIQIKADRQGTAIPLLEKVAALRPDKVEVWHYLGMAWQECHVPAKARSCFETAHKLKPTAFSLGNIGVTWLDQGDPKKAIEYVSRAIEMDPTFQGGRATMGFAQLSLGNWREGWKNYEACLGGRFRKELDFGAAKWDGSRVDNLIVYGEQGLGDEIMFASCLADAQKVAAHITLECDPRLEGLFKRSFPDIEVYGTRRLEQPWLEGRRFDAQCAIGSLPALFRESPESCPKLPYLKADPERRVMWRALFDSWRKPVIGLTWSGGRPASQKAERRVGVKAYADFIKRTNAEFVCLEYKAEAKAEIAESGLPVRFYDETVSADYDLTAALVAEMDYIVGPPTTVHHLAGALGVDSTILVNPRPMWNFFHGDRLAWNKAQVFHRQKEGESWKSCIDRLTLPSLNR